MRDPVFKITVSGKDARAVCNVLANHGATDVHEVVVGSAAGNEVSFAFEVASVRGYGSTVAHEAGHLFGYGDMYGDAKVAGHDHGHGETTPHHALVAEAFGDEYADLAAGQHDSGGMMSAGTDVRVYDYVTFWDALAQATAGAGFTKADWRFTGQSGKGSPAPSGQGGGSAKAGGSAKSGKASRGGAGPQLMDPSAAQYQQLNGDLSSWAGTGSNMSVDTSASFEPVAKPSVETEEKSGWQAAIDLAQEAAGIYVGISQGALESVVDFFLGLKDLAVLGWKFVKSLADVGFVDTMVNIGEKVGQIFDNAPELLRQLGASFAASWNAEGDFERGQFRGRVIGYAAMEIVLLLISGGAITAIKAGGKLGGVASKFIKVVKAVDAASDPTALLKGMSKAVKMPGELRQALKSMGDVEVSMPEAMTKTKRFDHEPLPRASVNKAEGPGVSAGSGHAPDRVISMDDPKVRENVAKADTLADRMPIKEIDPNHPEYDQVQFWAGDAEIGYGAKGKGLVDAHAADPNMRLEVGETAPVEMTADELLGNVRAHETVHMAQNARVRAHKADVTPDQQKIYDEAAELYPDSARLGDHYVSQHESLPKHAIGTRKADHLARLWVRELDAYRAAGTNGEKLGDSVWGSMADHFDNLKKNSPDVAARSGIDQITDYESARRWVYDWLRTKQDARLDNLGDAGVSAASKAPAARAHVAARAGTRTMNPTRGESPIWKALGQGRGGRKVTGKGKKRRYHEWDNTHNDIEVYDSRGRHLGSMDPTTGDMIKPAVKGRTIDL
jgi:hypothetical protein